jgi:hypothetical protein
VFQHFVRHPTKGPADIARVKLGLPHTLGLIMTTREGQKASRAAVSFLSVVALFLLLWMANAAITVPVAAIPAGNAIATILFMGIPVIGLYMGCRLDWTPFKAIATLVLCLAALAGLSLLATSPLSTGLMQLARLGWPMALGVLISSLIKDKNLLLPIAIVLAAVDFLAVLSPVGTVKHGLQSSTIRPVFDVLAFQLPKFGSITPTAQMGPADPLFLGMFFFAIHKFGTRSRETLLWMLPALVLYLSIVIVYGKSSVMGIPLGALPALVPIGAVVVAVNWREFSLSPSEKLMTAFVAILCVAAMIAAFISWQ